MLFTRSVILEACIDKKTNKQKKNHADKFATSRRNLWREGAL